MISSTKVRIFSLQNKKYDAFYRIFIIIAISLTAFSRFYLLICAFKVLPQKVLRGYFKGSFARKNKKNVILFCFLLAYSYLCTAFEAQMAESVDALVSNTSGATHPGSSPGLGTTEYFTQGFKTKAGGCIGTDASSFFVM